MEDQFSAGKAASSGSNIKEFFYKYVRFLPVFILSVAFTLLGAYLYLRYATPVYQSAGALLVKGSNAEEGGGGDRGDRFSQLFVLDNSINIQSEIELLKSRPLMERVVEKLGLNYQYYSLGNIDEVHHYKDLPFMVQAVAINDSAAEHAFEIRFNRNQTFTLGEQGPTYRFGQVFTLPQGRFALVRLPGELGETYRVHWLPTRTLASKLTRNLLVAPKGATGILNLELETSHPQMAADVLNQLMREYQVATIEDKNETKRQTLTFIDDRLKVVSRELDSVTTALLTYQRNNNLVDPTAQSTSFLTRMEAFNEQSREQEVQASIAQMIENYLDDSRNNFNVVPSSLGLADPTLNTMISAYNVAQLERKQLVEGKVPVTNARVQQMASQIEQLRLNILESLRNLKRSYRAAISRLQQERGLVKAEIEQLPVKEQNLLEIKKQQEMKQGVFNFLMEKREETAISLAATISNIKVVEEAAVNKQPVKPDRRHIQLIAIVLGLALPALFIFIMELLNDKVNSRADIEKITDVPILGEIGHSYADKTLLVHPTNRSIVAEQFRIIRSNLQYVLANINKPVILVTSSFSGEGKSFVSTNLGAVLSLAGKRTIILEFDIRKPKIMAGLGLGKKPGLTNWLLGKVQLEDLPVAVEGYDNLFILPCGPIPPNPGELLLNPQMEALFNWMHSHFDAVVVDTAPVGIVSDALTLSRFANATLYITRQGHTFKKQVEIIDDYKRQSKLPNLSIVLNDVRLETAYGYYSYGKYGYGYAQSAGYFDEEPGTNGGGSNGLLKWKKWKV